MDGSDLAETVLPAADYLARMLPAEVVLIHVVERDAPSEVHGARHLRTPDEAESYLEELSRTRFDRQVSTIVHVHSDDVDSVADGILLHVEEFNTDLILMCTHGRSGPRQFLFGTIAQQVVAHGRVPVLFFGSGHQPSQVDPDIHRLLVPLDGDPEHELGLKVAQSLAIQLEASIELLRVVPTLSTVSGSWTQTARLMPATASTFLDMAEEEAQTYLDKLKSEIEPMGVATSTELLRGDLPNLINDVVDVHAISLIVIGTHGKLGGDAFWSGSATPRICQSVNIPVLLVPTAADI